MPFFDQNFLLLDNTQTFIAAIATLIVLCFFRDDTANFIEKLIDSFNEFFIKDIRRSIFELSTASKKHFSFIVDWKVYSNSADEEDKQELLKIKADFDILKVDLYNDSEADKKKADEKSKEFEEQQKLPKERLAHTQTLMAFFTFVFCIAILTFDSLCFNRLFSGFLLFLLDFVLCGVAIAAWGDYLMVKPFNITKKHQIACFLLMIVFGGVFLFSNYIVFLILTFIVFSSYVLIHIIHKAQKDNYNYRAISKYALYSIGASFLGAVVMYFVVQETFLYDLAPIKIQEFFTIFVTHLMLLSNRVNLWRSVFVVVCVLNAFVLPLLLAYLKGRNKSRGIRKDIGKNYKKALSSLKQIEKNYNDLKRKINAKTTSSV